MPKIKTHQGMKKRVRATGKGKLKKAHANKSHNRITKTAENKRSYRKSLDIHKNDAKKVRRLTPYL